MGEERELLGCRFWQDGKEKEAWFDTNGAWYQTETDILFSELPEAVRTAFAAGNYKGWRVDDVDSFERQGTETFYVLDVENANQDYDLHYSADGTRIKEVADR